MSELEKIFKQLCEDLKQQHSDLEVRFIDKGIDINNAIIRIKQWAKDCVGEEIKDTRYYSPNPSYQLCFREGINQCREEILKKIEEE